MQLTTVAAVATLAVAAQAAPSPNLWGWGNSGWGSSSSNSGWGWSSNWGNNWGISQWSSQVPKAQAPWTPGCKPAFCSNSLQIPGIPQFGQGDLGFLCQGWLSSFIPFCQQGNQPCTKPPGPTPSGPTCQSGYQVTQSNYVTTPNTGVYSGVANTGAAASDPSYMTYGLVKNNAECISLCSKTSGCLFANVYQAQYPPNETPKDLSATAAAQYVVGQLTCALFSKCLDNSAFTNYGGQNDPSFITQSYGFCRAQTCPN